MILFAYHFVISQAGKWKEERTAKGVFSIDFEGCNKAFNQTTVHKHLTKINSIIKG